MRYYYVSYLYVDNFITDYDLKCYKKTPKDFKLILSLYMDYVYLYIYRRYRNYLLKIEVFPYSYRFYTLKWPGNLEDFLSLINSLGIINIRKGVNKTNNDLNCEQEDCILHSVLEFLVNDKDFMTNRYGLK